MVHDAESHAAEDRQAREAVDARNRADQLVYQVEKTLADSGRKVSEADQAEVRSAVQAVRDALAQGEPSAIAAASERLERASHQLAEAIYRAQPAPDGESGSGGSGPASGDGTSSTPRSSTSRRPEGGT